MPVVKMAKGADKGVGDATEGCETQAIGLGCSLEAFTNYDEVAKLIEGLKDEDTSFEALKERFIYVFDQYQEQPHLLDPYLSGIVSQLVQLTQGACIHKAFKLLYVITKVRGYKVLIHYLPHEVSDFEPVLKLLTVQNVNDPDTWETRYMLLLWMSIIAIMPFHLRLFDPGFSDDCSVIHKVIDVIKTYLLVSDKARDAAAFLASKLLTRPDCRDIYLPEFFTWALQEISKRTEDTQENINAQAGILQTFSLLFKCGRREDMKKHASNVFAKIMDLELRNSMSSLVRKMFLKTIQRIGLCFLRLKIAPWRYSRGCRSLTANLAGAPTMNEVPVQAEDAEGDDDWEYDVPEEIEDIIEQLLNGLRDRDTIIRWSAAKGIGRITGRLPKDLADDIVDTVLTLFSLRESDSAWHGGCLTLAELGRRGLLLPHHLVKAVPVVIKSLTYDELRGNFSVGSHIRDAACYVCWSFARAYDPKVLLPYVTDLARALLVTSVFDREVNCRRAAGAALQEIVGRQGTVPHGIEIIASVDYFSVGSRTNSFLNLSVCVAHFPEHTESLIDHLLKHKVGHWDIAIRELAAKSLHNLTRIAPEFMRDHCLPELLSQTLGTNLNMRHGSIIAVGDILHGLAEWSLKDGKGIRDVLDDSTVEQIGNISQKLAERNQFRGLGGELMKQAVCWLINKASLSALPVSSNNSVLDSWLEVIHECLVYDLPHIRQAGAMALNSFCSQYLMEGDHRQKEILRVSLEGLKNELQRVRCGYALALGSLPRFMLVPEVSTILDGLINCATDGQTETFTESRSEAIRALSHVCQTVGLSGFRSEGEGGVTQEMVCRVFDCLLLSMKDYTVDSRGDVGATVREAAMRALQDITLLSVGVEMDILLEDLVHKIFSSLMQQCVEKIDRTRAVAGGVFSMLLHSFPQVPNVPHRTELMTIFPSEVCATMNWAAPASTFPLFSRAIPLTSYTYSLILGFAISVGGVTESLVKHSRSSFLEQMNAVRDNAECFVFICDTLLKVFTDHFRVDRVTVPFLRMTDHLLNSGVFDALPPDYKLDFLKSLADQCWKEVSKSGDPNKLIAAISVFCGFAQFSGPVQRKALSTLAIFLCHRFPRIRKATAQSLYEAVVSYGEECLQGVDLDEAMAILGDTDWDASVELIRPVRNRLCEVFGVPAPRSLKAAN